MHIRSGRPGDAPFVIKSWLRSFNEHLRPEDRRCGYWDAHKEVIADLLTAGALLVAHDAADDNAILGFACGEPRLDMLVLHYVYTKREHRRKGVARALVTELRTRTKAPTVVVTHLTTWDIQKYCRVRDWGIAQHAPYYRTIMRMRGIAA